MSEHTYMIKWRSHEEKYSQTDNIFIIIITSARVNSGHESVADFKSSIWKIQQVQVRIFEASLSGVFLLELSF